MPYMTSIERLARVEISREMLLDVVSARFINVPQDISNIINNIKLIETLRSLIRQAAVCESLDDFRKNLLSAQNRQLQA